MTTYEASGVARLDETAGFKSLIGSLRETFALRAGAGRSLLDFGYYASVLDLGESVPQARPGGQALAFSTDGVGTKAIAAQLADRYDTVGIDCVAMNANDVLCVGAEPVAMLDYVACDLASDRLLSELGVGLLEGARQANISIPGGEVSQIKEIITGPRPGYAFDLVGTCIGLVDREAVIVGQDIEPGHAVVGLASSGIHSNGLTLARAVLVEESGLKPDPPREARGPATRDTSGLKPDPPKKGGTPNHEKGLGPNQVADASKIGGGSGFHPDSRRMAIDTHVAEFGRTLGEELLEPTRIYVKAVLPLIQGAERAAISGLFHLTSDGFLNLLRCRADVSFEIDALPEPQPVFQMIQRLGNVTDAEMYAVFNMGVGFCVVCEPGAVSGVIGHAKAAGVEAWEIGRAIASAGALRPGALRPGSLRPGSGQAGDPSTGSRPGGQAGRTEGKRVYLRERGLVGENGRFAAASN